jgi:hypothetical protein
MKPKHLLLLAACLCLTAASHAQTTFLRSFASDNYPPGLALLPNGAGYLMCGHTESANRTELHFLRLDPDGLVLGDAGLTVGGDDMFIEAVAPMADGSFMAVGAYIGGFHSGFTVQLSANGVPTSFASQDMGFVASWRGLAASPDSTALAVGYGFEGFSHSVGALTRFNSQGDTLWTRLIGEPGFEISFEDVARLPSGDFLVVGTRAPQSNVLESTVLYRIGADGSLQWGKSYASAMLRLAGNGLALKDGNAYIALSVQDEPDTSSTVGVMAVDTNGTLLWLAQLDGQEDAYPYDITVSPGGNPVLAGSYETASAAPGFTAALSPTGALLWSNGYAPGGIVYELLPAPGGGYLAAMADPDVSPGLYLGKTDAQGRYAGNCVNLSPNWTVSLLSLNITNLNTPVRAGYPLVPVSLDNPALTMGSATLCSAVATSPAVAAAPVRIVPQPMLTGARLYLPEATHDESVTLVLHDMAGKEVDMAATRTADGFELQRSGLPVGLYAYQVLQGGQRIASGKLLVTD